MSKRQFLLVLLAINSGATDAIGFVALGGAFTSVMTGNMILLGISASTSGGGLAVRSGLAIVLFVAGAFAGSRIARTPRPEDPVWPRAVTVALTTELVALLAFAAGWWAAGGHPQGRAQLALLGVDAVALGIQSSAIVRFGVSGLSTTYMTGTLTNLVVTLAQGKHPRNVLSSAQILVGLIVGAVAAALFARHAPVLVPVLQLGPVGGAIAANLKPSRVSVSGALLDESPADQGIPGD